VVHVQELMGLPSSLLDVAREGGARVVMTLQDYFPLCCTMRLTGECCMSASPGRGCVGANAGAPVDAGPIVARTVGFELTRAKEALPLVRRVSFAGLRKPGAPVSAPVTTRPADYDRRRAVNVERLNRVDKLIAMSERVAEIYRELGVERVETMEFTLAHIERMHPRRARPAEPLTFATLNGCASPSKGSEVILGALRKRPFRLLVYGFVDPAAEDELRGFDGVEVRGLYDRQDLDELLEEVDVGILPSTWEEAYAYTGAEFRAKGIPVIANDIGGMREHGTWLNHSCTGEELAEIIAGITPEPRPPHVKSFAEHLDELYR
jgi:glycosyltransferase involved in cell wall biosynthesis